MDIENFDYEKDASIDESALDTEWLQIPKLIMRYTSLEAQARREVSQSKADLDIIGADLDKKLRTNPEKYDLPKTTETAISNGVKSQKVYMDAEEEVRQAEYELNMAQAAVKAMYAKKDALENLVRLHGQQYFAGPKVPRDIGQEWAKKAEQKSSNRKVKIKQKRQRKRSK